MDLDLYLWMFPLAASPHNTIALTQAPNLFYGMLPTLELQCRLAAHVLANVKTSYHHDHSIAK